MTVTLMEILVLKIYCEEFKDKRIKCSNEETFDEKTDI